MSNRSFPDWVCRYFQTYSYDYGMTVGEMIGSESRKDEGSGYLRMIRSSGMQWERFMLL